MVYPQICPAYLFSSRHGRCGDERNWSCTRGVYSLTLVGGPSLPSGGSVLWLHPGLLGEAICHSAALSCRHSVGKGLPRVAFPFCPMAHPPLSKQGCVSLYSLPPTCFSGREAPVHSVLGWPEIPPKYIQPVVASALRPTSP